jgi:antitoxin HigA-1
MAEGGGGGGGATGGFVGKFCGNGPGLWLRMQQAYVFWHAERALKKVVAKILTARARAV